MFKHLLLITLLFITATKAFSQAIPPAQRAMALQELQNRGITEAEFRAKMQEKGIDIDNVKPEQLPGLEPVIRQAVAELEAEKKKAATTATPAAALPGPTAEKMETVAEQLIEEKAKEVASEKAADIQEAVKQGASVPEAIGETLAEAAKEDNPPTGIYGQDVFRKQSIQLYKTVKDVKPPDSYVLGAGDQVSVSIWGASQADFTYEINEDGYIAPTGLPRIFLKGITYGQAKGLLRSRLSQFYVFRPEQFALSLNAARTITVNIFGEVFNYGSFTISAVNTAFNALVASGGPSDIGTLRNIQLIRGGKTLKVDVYEFLFDPRVQYNFFLENNDILFVPVAERVVSIQGAVKRPFRYELIKGENLLKLVEYAGGLTLNAYKKSIQVQRISGDETILMDIDYQDLLNNKKDFELQNGDIVSFRNIPGRLENFAEITGAVEFPGRYDLSANMRITDLLNKGMLRKETRTDIAFLLRQRPDQTSQLIRLNLDSLMADPGNTANLLLKPKDRILTYTLERFVDKAIVSVTGAVRSPVTHPYDPDETITVQDLVLLAGGLQQDAAQYGYIKRTDLSNPKIKEYIRVDVFEALNNPASPTNITLRPEDVLQVYNQSRFTDAFSVQVTGAVRNPGSFDFDSTLTISDVIYISGGLQQDAAQYGYILRTDITNPKNKSWIRIDLFNALQQPASADNAILQPGDLLQIWDRSRFTDAADIAVSGSVRAAGTFDYDQNLRLSDVIYLAGGPTRDATDFGYLIRTDFNNFKEKEYLRVNVKEALNNRGGQADLFLLPFDRIEIMSVTTFTDEFSVEVSGAVRNPGRFTFGDGLTMQDLLTMAGGLKLKASANRIDVFRLIIQDNQPTQTITASLSVDENFRVLNDPGFQLEPFDKVVVRTVPEFEMQRTVTLNGEVKYPGIYALTSKNERLNSLIKRAGGLTMEAFAQGANLYRTDNNTGVVITRLERAIANRGSRFNYILKNGDILSIPKAKELVTIELGATMASALYAEKMVTGGKFNVAYHGTRRAGWYLREYAGGINRDVRARKNLISVEYPNGQIKKTTDLLLFKVSPKVRKGSVVSVGIKPEKIKEDRPQKEREPFDVQRTVTNVLSLAISALTVMVLSKQL